MVNIVFQKNISALCAKNPKLAAKLKNFIPQQVPQVIQDNGKYNLLYRGKFIHNQNNPFAEADEIFKKTENSPVSIHFIYGMGLGYLFQIFAQNSKGTVILFEPDINILWTSFTLVDFSADILKENVYISGSLEEVSEVIYKNSGTKNSPTMLSLPSQREFNPAEFDAFVKNLQEIVGSFSLDLKYTKEKLYPSLKMLFKNIPNLYKEIPLVKIKDFYKNKTAVVVSAGPTLDKNIETLKKYRDNFVLLTVGTAAKTLYENGIKPDFICIIETYNSSKQLDGLDLSGVNFITEPYSNPSLRKFSFKNIFSHISANSPINTFWSEVCGENIEEYSSMGTVSYTALNCARILGCSKIILVGQDLAYIEGQCYSKDSAYKDLYCKYNNEIQKWEIKAKDFEQFAAAISASSNPETRKITAEKRLKNLNSSLYFVKGINGDMIPTESVYATFIGPLSEYTTLFNDREYINTSLTGAQIDGFKNMSLEEALQDSKPIANIDFKIDFEYDSAKIKEILTNKLSELKTSLSIIEEGRKTAKNLNNNLKRYRNANEEVLKDLKKLSLNYLALTGNFSNKSKLFDFITVADKINIDYELKITQEFTTYSISNIAHLILDCYNNAENRIKEIEGLINESFNTKS